MQAKEWWRLNMHAIPSHKPSHHQCHVLETGFLVTSKRSGGRLSPTHSGTLAPGNGLGTGFSSWMHLRLSHVYVSSSPGLPCLSTAQGPWIGEDGQKVAVNSWAEMKRRRTQSVPWFPCSPLPPCDWRPNEILAVSEKILPASPHLSMHRFKSTGWQHWLTL